MLLKKFPLRITSFGKKSLLSSFSKKSFSSEKIINEHNINPQVLKAEYAVRGEIAIKADEISKKLEEQKKTGVKTLPFDELVYCNIGNPQSLGQKPITFFRQVLSIVQYPELLQSPAVSSIFPSDVISRAKKALSGTVGGIGAYSHSQGIPFVRNEISDFISRRDGYPSDPNDIFLYNGASPAVQDILRLIIRNNKDGILIPIPQYPLYSASIALLSGTPIQYYLNEEDNWSLSVDELQRSFDKAKSQGINPRALVVINPGNPTGQVLTESNMKDIVEFCFQNRVLLMADEVYQENVYIKQKLQFNSFKKVSKSMGSKYKDFELVSFNSVSKGFTGECGQRSGYLEAVNFSSEAKAQLYKLASVLLCPNTAGQILMSLMVNPPKEGDPSYTLYIKERDLIYESLKRRAIKLSAFLNTLEGVTCNTAQGAMYAFPQIRLSSKAMQAAKSVGKEPDNFYSLSMLEETGIVVVPGSGFGQKDGTYHFRTTFLPQESKIDLVMERMKVFHSNFLKKYS